MNDSATYSCRHFIGGVWTKGGGNALPNINPSTGESLCDVPMADSGTVDSAVRAAAEAFPAWAATPAPRRVQTLFRYKHLLETHFDEIARLITLEHGKTLAEAKGSLRRGIEVADMACGVPMLIKGETLANAAPSVDYETHRFPVGVCAGITPFNFPAMIPMWMFPVALACGNAFVLKPSEQTPLTAVRLVELLDEAGLPKGVLNLVHGGREAVDALIAHPEVKAVSFVGSTPVARAIHEKASALGKRVQAAGGAKNHLVLMPDAPEEAAIEIMTSSAFGCAGERCMATSAVLAPPASRERFMEPLRRAAAAYKVGPTDRGDEATMGPVISQSHRERVLNYIDTGEREGAKVLCDGRGVKVADAPGGFYVGPTILDGVRPEHTAARDEIFGPVLSVIHEEDLDSAIERINRNPYGNAAVILTSSGPAAREFRHRVKCGMVGINVGVPAPMAYFPFTGWNDSFFGDLHIQGLEGIAFYTQQKVCIARWY